MWDWAGAAVLAKAGCASAVKETVLANVAEYSSYK